MKRTELILFFLFASFFLTPSVIHAQVLSDGQPSVLKEDQNPPNYVYDLKQLIKKSRENIKNVDLKIKEQAVIKRNQKREEKAREYYEQAMKLQEEGRLEEARQLFEKAIHITDHPEMQGYIKESEHRAKAQENALQRVEEDQERRLTEEERSALQKAEDEYQTAVSLYRQQKFKEAKTAFEVVEETAPDYKGVRSYLQIIEQDIAQQDNLAVKDQKKEIERQQKEAEVARLREKELWRKEIEQKEEDRKNQLKKQADAAYNEAIKLYQDKKYQAAKEKFQEVDWVVPDFKATRAYLGRIDQDIENDRKRLLSEREKELEKQRWQETLAQRKTDAEREKALQAKERERLAQIKDQAEFLYGAAVALFEKNSYAQAKEKFDEIESIYPNYKLTRNYLKKVEQLLGLPTSEYKPTDPPPTIAGKSSEDQKQMLVEEASRRQAEQENFKKISVETEDAFNIALAFYKSGRLIEAKEKFLAVDQMIPDYKSTRSYLKRIDEDIELLAKTHKREQEFLDQKAEIEKLKALKDKADALYSTALASFDAKDFDKAKSGFLEVEMTLPDFKKTKFYLQRIDEEIVRQKEEFKRKEIESQANVAYAQAVVLYNTGQFEEAKKKFIEVEAILPNYKDVTNYLEHIDDDIIAKKEKDLAHLKELQVEGPYAEALILYQNRDFQLAKTKFLEVMAVYPDYKDTAKFLNKIDDDIERQRKETELREKTEQAEMLYKQAVEMYHAGDFSAAKDKFVKLEVVWPDYKEAPRYLGRIDGDIALKNRKEELSRRTSEAEPVYDQALSLYKEQEFLEAKKKFMQVQIMCPGFRDTALYLTRIDKDIQSQEGRVARSEQLRKADELYTQAVNLYAQRKFEEAKVKLLETAGVDPQYKNLRSYLSRIDSDIRFEAASLERRNKEQSAEEPYAQAVILYHDRKFAEAKEKFLETTRILPDYKKARSYLSRIDQDIHEGKRRAEQERISKAVALYREAQVLLAEKKLAEAVNKFSELEELYPDYKNTRTLLEHIKSRLATKEVPVASTFPAPAASDSMKMAAVTPSDNVFDEKVFALYKEAVVLYKAKNYSEAKIRFDQVATLKAHYRSTEKYLQSIDEILGTHKKVEASVKVQPPATAVKAPQPSAPVKVQLPATPAVKEQEALTLQAGALYQEAVRLYNNGKYDEAKSKFEQIESTWPGYKSSRRYIVLATKAKEKAAKPKVSPVQSDKDAEAVHVLAKRSEEIYRQIKALAQDKDMANALQTFAQVDHIISNLEAEQKQLQAQVEEQQRRDREALIRQKRADETAELLKNQKIQAETEKLRQVQEQKLADEEHVRLSDLKTKEKDKEKQEQRALDIRVENRYQQALEAVKNKKYDEARNAFSEIEAVRPHYKDSVRILTKMDREEGEAKLTEYENNDRKAVSDLVERASVINLEIVQLTEARNYDEIHKKFDELSGILQEIKNIKDRLMARRHEFASQWEKRMATSKISALTAQGAPEKFMADLDAGIAAEKARSILREGQKLYADQKYAEAKVKFIEASRLDPTLKAATTYLNRINRLQEQHDFEEQKKHNKREARNLEKKTEDSEVSKEATDKKTDEKEKELAVADRNKLVFKRGIELYRSQRYREARIKFEELIQTGDAKQSDKAKRYLALIEKTLEREKVDAAKKHQAELESYLHERKAQESLSVTNNKIAVSGVPSQALTRGERDLEIQRQQELRLIEKQNMIERGLILNAHSAQDELVGREKRDKSQSRNSSIKDSKSIQKRSPVDTSAKKEINSEQKKELQEAQSSVRPMSADKKGTMAITQCEQVKYEKAKLNKKEVKRRQELASERVKLTREKELIKKAQREDARNKYDRNEVSPEGMEKELGLETKIASTDSVLAIESHSKMETGNEQDTALRMAMEHEKRVLEQQREAIRRDFEIGVDRLYNDAVGLFKERLYEEARQNFLQVTDMIKGYKKTDNYLGQIDRILKSNHKKSSVKSSRPILNPLIEADSSISEARRRQVISGELDSLEEKAQR